MDPLDVTKAVAHGTAAGAVESTVEIALKQRKQGRMKRFEPQLKDLDFAIAELRTVAGYAPTTICRRPTSADPECPEYETWDATDPTHHEPDADWRTLQTIIGIYLKQVYRDDVAAKFKVAGIRRERKHSDGVARLSLASIITKQVKVLEELRQDFVSGDLVFDPATPDMDLVALVHDALNRQRPQPVPRWKRIVRQAKAHITRSRAWARFSRFFLPHVRDPVRKEPDSPL